MEVEKLTSDSQYDWLRKDREEYLILSYTASGPFGDDRINNNSFCTASLKITKAHRPEEFKTIRERNTYYDFISYLFDFSAVPKPKAKDIKFFHATATVTTFSVIGAAESISRRLALSKESINILTDVNILLFSENMFVIRYLLYDPVLSIPFKFVNNSPCVVGPVEISCFDFDIQMVNYEQSIVANYMNANSQKFTPEVIKEINNTLNPGFFVQYVVKPVNIAGDVAIPWAKSALNVEELNFMNYSHRYAIGVTTVHVFHKKKYSDYFTFINTR